MAQAIDSVESGVPAVDRQPQQLQGLSGFRGVALIVIETEADPAVIGDEGGMAFAYPGLDGLKVGMG